MGASRATVTGSVLAALLAAVCAPVLATEARTTAGSEAAWTDKTASASRAPADIIGRARGPVRLTYVKGGSSTPKIGAVRVSTRAQAQAAVRRIQSDPRTIAVEVDQARAIDDAVPTAPTAIDAAGRPGSAPGDGTTRAGADIPAADPLRTSQWALDRMRAESIWPTTTGVGVVVAVLDSGVARHPDLAGTFLPGKDFIGGGDGRTDPNGHGTHVAGLIAMTVGNGIGGAGLAPGVSLLPVRVANAGGTVYASTSAKGIVWAAKHGANVINMSYSGSYSPVEETAVEYALSKGITLAAAVGNTYYDDQGRYFNPVRFPAGYGDVLGVAATNRAGTRPYYSEVGTQVDLAGPGGQGRSPKDPGLIVSSYNDGGYQGMQGTSMATPYVSAAAALVLAQARALGVKVDIADLLVATAVDIGRKGADPKYGFGEVNPSAGLAALANLPPIVHAERPTLVPMRVTIRDRRIVFRVPATGRFEVFWHRKRDGTWSKLRYLGKVRGKRSYRLDATAPGRYQLIVRVWRDRDSDPLWISGVLRIR